jgi:hypothetical protein
VDDQRQWVEKKLKEIEYKREILNSLKATLAKWEEDVEWESLPAPKQAALMALADESVETLTTMIERLGTDIRQGLAGLSGTNGEPVTNE